MDLPLDTVIYRRLLPLYFPRSAADLDLQACRPGYRRARRAKRRSRMRRSALLAFRVAALAGCGRGKKQGDAAEVRGRRAARQRQNLPADVGNEKGEPVVQERQVRLSARCCSDRTGGGAGGAARAD